MGPDDLVPAAIANLAAWHECSVAALGFPGRTGAHWWICPTPRPWIYFTAIELEPAGDPRGAAGVAGRARRPPRRSPWGVSGRVPQLRRPRARARRAGPPLRGPLVRPPTCGPTTGRAARRPRDRGGRRRGRPGRVRGGDLRSRSGRHRRPRPSTCTRHRCSTTRRCGSSSGAATARSCAGRWATSTTRSSGSTASAPFPANAAAATPRALTLAVLDLAPGRPATLQPSDAAARMYRALGFEEVGRFSHWG